MAVPSDEDLACLDRFIPHFDVRERFETTFRTSAALVLETAIGFDMQSLVLVRGVLRLRERLLSATPPTVRRSQGILAETTSLGWGLLEERPGHFVGCGAVCQTWLAEVQFAALSPDSFAPCQQAGQVKIA